MIYTILCHLLADQHIPPTRMMKYINGKMRLKLKSILQARALLRAIFLTKGKFLLPLKLSV